ncbi:phage terminase large subunit [Hyphomicrobium sp. ghe19]|uniref:phage terminase large subunit n=1 Tax=Hyphomicrobium sp. ghe19 TaxID=2682968 RepID=UPI0013679314|nr:hypothetical protein HYPP_02638 [Hyphomicrobium sp. ghe19]
MTKKPSSSSRGRSSTKKTKKEKSTPTKSIRKKQEAKKAVALKSQVEGAVTASLYGEKIKEDFRVFLRLVWRQLQLPEPTPVQLDIAKFLQHGPRRKVIEAFRGVGKSWITSAYVLWLLYCEPQHKILVVSATKERSDQFSTFTMRLISEMPLLVHLKPRDEQRQSKIAFDVGPARADHAPSVKSAGIFGQITGSRADHIVADDIEVPNNSDTQMAREKLAESVKEFDAILKPLPHATITYLGTPQTEMSLYNTLPDRGYVIRIWPARIPDDVEKYGGKLAPYIHKLIEKGAKPGDPVDPRRFGYEDLAERALSYGRSGFALQFQLDTSLSDADRYPLKLSDLIVMSLPPDKGPVDVTWATSPELVDNDLPAVGLEGDRYYRPVWTSKEWSPYTGCVMYVDPSGRGKDETAICVAKALYGRVFITYIAGFRDGYSDETIKKILLIAKSHGVKEIVVEPNFGDGMFSKLLMAQSQVLYRVSIVDSEWSRAQKEARIIDVLEPVMNQHRLVIDKSVIWYDYKSTETYIPEEQNRYRAFYQMSRLTKDRGALVSDDRIEAIAGAVKYWTDHFAKDTTKSVKDHKAQELDEELKKFMKHAIDPRGNRGGSKKSPFLGGLKAFKSRMGLR